MTTKKYQACVRERAIQSAKLVSQSAELLRQVAMQRACAAGKLTAMWKRIHTQASCLAASAAVAIVEEEEMARSERKLAKNCESRLLFGL